MLTLHSDRRRRGGVTTADTSGSRRGVTAVAILLTGALAGSLAGCGSAPVKAESSTGATTIENCGVSMTYPKSPKRAVTMDQGATETLLALGAHGQMAGASNIKTKVPAKYQAQYDAIKVLNPKILSGEQARGAHPDILVSSFKSFFNRDQVGERNELSKAGIPSYVSAVECSENHPGKDAFARLALDYETLGSIFGHEKEAKALVEEQNRAVAEAKADKARLTKPVKAVFVYSAYSGQPYVAGASSIPQALTDITGTTNIFADVKDVWPEVQWEQVGSRDPDVIVLADLSARGRPGDKASEKIAEFKKNPATKHLDAVKNNRFITLNGMSLDVSPRMPQAIRTYIDGLEKLGYLK